MLLIVSIILEVAVAVIAILTARQGRPYMYGLAFTFVAYVFHDLARCGGFTEISVNLGHRRLPIVAKWQRGA
jgi:hypothetical protein